MESEEKGSNGLGQGGILGGGGKFCLLRASGNSAEQGGGKERTDPAKKFLTTLETQAALGEKARRFRKNVLFMRKKAARR